MEFRIQYLNNFVRSETNHLTWFITHLDSPHPWRLPIQPSRQVCALPVIGSSPGWFKERARRPCTHIISLRNPVHCPPSTKGARRQ